MRKLLIVGRRHGEERLELLNPTQIYSESLLLKRALIKKPDPEFALVMVFEGEPERVIKSQIQPKTKGKK